MASFPEFVFAWFMSYAAHSLRNFTANPPPAATESDATASGSAAAMQAARAGIGAFRRRGSAISLLKEAEKDANEEEMQLAYATNDGTVTEIATARRHEFFRGLVCFSRPGARFGCFRVCCELKIRVDSVWSEQLYMFCQFLLEVFTPANLSFNLGLVLNLTSARGATVSVELRLSCSFRFLLSAAHPARREGGDS